ncbi:MAG: hypothetical protein M0T85_01870 [Dehalococcoidales bacterium]|nr:hypothetical protein [Dehalococcoidales bacterium]
MSCEASMKATVSRDYLDKLLLSHAARTMIRHRIEETIGEVDADAATSDTLTYFVDNQNVTALIEVHRGRRVEVETNDQDLAARIRHDLGQYLAHLEGLLLDYLVAKLLGYRYELRDKVELLGEMEIAVRSDLGTFTIFIFSPWITVKLWHPTLPNVGVHLQQVLTTLKKGGIEFADVRLIESAAPCPTEGGAVEPLAIGGAHGG